MSKGKKAFITFYNAFALKETEAKIFCLKPQRFECQI